SIAKRMTHHLRFRLVSDQVPMPGTRSRPDRALVQPQSSKAQSMLKAKSMGAIPAVLVIRAPCQETGSETVSHKPHSIQRVTPKCITPNVKAAATFREG